MLVSRVFTVYGMLNHRGKTKSINVHNKPTHYTAKKANEV
ncbi:uncharacterized protein MP3633_1613 [Marinomonas primoryensis]|uniref:Uncharacterized protein n=1 Tax=Marinomonas primoryensis TaxID=178399 RepID=A0A859CV34_9GAMM|nr:uncharacterized protein MP3633_1613 [Marinomonas primoryensis]